MMIYEDVKVCNEPKEDPTFADIIKDNHSCLVELENVVDSMARSLFGAEPLEREPQNTQDMISAFAMDANTTHRILDKVITLNKRLCG